MNNAQRLAMAAILVACGFFALQYRGVPSTVSADAPTEQFSSGRAMVYLREIAREPHPVNSEAHSQVLDYLQQTLTELGLTPTRQTLENSEQGGNLWITLPGTASQHTVLFSAHYDSVANGPGAGDNGAAVAACLEAIRILSKNPTKNDLVFLFTDQEESGMKGAQAFALEQPLAREVDVVFNFDGRGSSGPIQMFETTNNNSWLISEFARATSQATGISLANDIYKRMPNYTDFTVYKKELNQIQGMNFAHVERPRTYHNADDTVENLDERVLQMQGMLITDLAKHFGNLASFEQSGSDRTYFTLPLLGMITLASIWTPIMLVIALVLFAMAVANQKREERITVKGMLGAAILYPIAMFLVLMVCNITWQIIRSGNPAFQNMLTGHPANGEKYLFGCILATVVIHYGLSRLWARKFRPENLIFGTLTFLALVSIAVSVILPGGAYVFILPLLIITVCLWLTMTAKLPKLAITVLTLPVLFIFGPVISLVYLGLGMSAVGGISLLTGMMLGYLTVNQYPAT